MQLADSYIQLIDNAQPTLDSGNTFDLRELYLHFGIDLDPSFQASKVIHDFLIDQMKVCLLATDETNHLSGFNLRMLRNHLALSHFSGDLSSKVMEPLETLFYVGALADKVPPFESEDVWLRAISLAKDYAIVDPYSVQHSLPLERNYCRQYAVSQGVRYFREKGYEISIENAKPVVEERSLRKIAEGIEYDIKALGGAWFVGYIFESNKGFYDNSMQRIHFVRRYETIPTVEGCTPGVPCGYLLNLAIKHSQELPELLKADERSIVLKRVIETSRYFTALYDVQNYYQLTAFLQSTYSLINFVQDTALYDSFFVPAQLRPSDVPLLLEGLFSWFDQRDMYEKLGFDLDDYIAVIRQILALPKQKIKPTHFHRTNVTLSGGRKAPRDAIWEILSHSPQSINADFCLTTTARRHLLTVLWLNYQVIHSAFLALAGVARLVMKLSF